MSAPGEIIINNVDELLVRMKKETYEENVKLIELKKTIITHIQDLMKRLDIRYHAFIDELQTKDTPEKGKSVTVKRDDIDHIYETLTEHMDKRIAEGNHIVRSVVSLQSDSSLGLKEKREKTSELLKSYNLFIYRFKEFHEKYDAFYSIYKGLWDDLTIHNTNQSRKINKLGQPGRARRYDTSLESIKEDNNANNAGASGGSQRKKRTRRQKRTLRKKHTRRHRA